MGSRGAAFLYLEALNLQAMATPAGAGRGGCQRRGLLGMCAARRQNSVTQLLLLALPVLLCTHRGCPCHPSLPCVQTSLAARKQRALLPASDRFSAFGAELALVGDWVGGSPHSDPTSLPPAPTPTSDQGVPVLHHPSASSDECCGCCRGHCTLPERQLRPQVGATDPKPTQKVLCNCTY